MAFTSRECFSGNGVPECMDIKAAPGLYFSKMFIKSVGGKLLDAAFVIPFLMA